MPGMQEQEQERPWALHEDEWDTPDGGASRARAKQASSSLQSDWGLRNTPTPTGQGKHTHTSHRREYQKGTPSTEATSPGFTGEAIPENYLKVIGDAFGPRADLHSQVLAVPRDASPREIRIAYFRQGRHVLSERPFSVLAAPQSASISGAVTDMAKLRFQAVSMAYEVVSNPAWFDSYEKYRALFYESDDDGGDDDEADVLSTPSKPRSVTSMSALRRVSSTGSLKSSIKSITGVRWNEEVEELVFKQDPEEVSFKTDRKQQDASKQSDKNRDRKKKDKRKKKKKKSKRRIAVEAENLEQHLEQLDKEAQNHFVDDFLDDLERSVDEFFNFKGDSEDSVNDEDYDYVEETVMTGKKLFPELEVKPLPEETSRAQTKPSSRRQKDIDAERKVEEKKATLEFHTDYAIKTETPNMRHVVDQEGPPIEAYRKDSRHESPEEEPFDSPRFSAFSSREQVQPPGRVPPTLDPWLGGANMNPANMNPANINPQEKLMLALEEARAGPQRQKPPLGTRPANRTASPLNNPVPRHEAKGASPPPRFDAPKDIHVMKTFEKRSFDDGESAAFTVDDTISTLSASVVQRHVNRDLTNSRYQAQPEKKLGTTYNLDDTGEAVVPSLRESPHPQTRKKNSKLYSTPVPITTAAISPGGNSEVNNILFCDNFCGDVDDVLPNSPGVLTSNRSREEPDFTVYLMAYMREINKDLMWLGESIQNGIQTGSFMEAVTISEEDLDGMLGILETELVELPDDYSFIKNEFARGRMHNV
jgi:hypothetical protein